MVVNLYPFRETLVSGAGPAQIVEMIDVGGPAMVRAAAKNFGSVAVVVDPGDYPRCSRRWKRGEACCPRGCGGGSRPRPSGTSRSTTRASRPGSRRGPRTGQTRGPQGASPAGSRSSSSACSCRATARTPTSRRRSTARPAALGSSAASRQLQGKELSWNNLLDADAARKIVALVREPAVAIVKHNNPCGVGRGNDLVEAYHRALATDPVSAFGSIIAVNRPVDGVLAEAMADLFVEVVVAPGFDEAALARFGKKTALRLLACPPYAGVAGGDVELRSIDGGLLAQAPDGRPDDPAAWTCPTERQPSPEERRALELAWAVARYVKSNAIVIANGDQTVGIGAGQMSRVDSCRLAIGKAQLPLAGTAAASDAFFPFRDGLDVLAEAGVTAVVQPGGSKRDDEVIAAADEHGIAMLLTGVRHFRH